MEQFSIPLWQIIISLVLALIYASVLYYKNSKDGLSSVWKWILASIRFFCIFTLGILFFCPVLQTRIRTVEKPILFLAIDQSESMKGTCDSLSRADLLIQIEKLHREASANFNIIPFGFGKTIEKNPKPEFNQIATDYQCAFEYIKNSGHNRDAAVILISDGNINSGTEPVQAYRQCAFPLYTVAWGDTSIQPDLAITRCKYNRYLYQGETFPIIVGLTQTMFQDVESQLKIYCDRNLVNEIDIEFQRPYKEVEVNLPCPEEGTHHYYLELKSIDKEKNTHNNTYSFYISVINKQKRICILANAPHPDISSINHSLRSSPIYQSEVILAKDLHTLPEADLYILHGLPSEKNSLDEWKELLESKPLWFILHSSTDIHSFNRWKTGIEIQTQGFDWNEAQASLSEKFSLFSTQDNWKATLEKLPPLSVPFASYKTGIGGQTLLYQRIMQVTTTDPLLWISPENYPASRAVLCGSGLWRWSLEEYRQTLSQECFNTLLDQCLQILTQEQPNEQLVIRCPEICNQQDRLVLEAELYNPAFEKITSADIEIDITREDPPQQSEVYHFRFTPRASGYVLDAGFLPGGEYTYQAYTQIGEQKLETEGKFHIQSSDIEKQVTQTRTDILERLAKNYNGKFYVNSLENLLPDLLQREDLKPLITYKEGYRNLLGYKWILIALLVLFSAEFFFRKYKGNL